MHVIKNIISSAAKTETGELFHNPQRSVPMLLSLQYLGYPRLSNRNPIKTKKNPTSNSFIHSSMQQIIPSTGITANIVYETNLLKKNIFFVAMFQKSP